MCSKRLKTEPSDVGGPLPPYRDTDFTTPDFDGQSALDQDALWLLFRTLPNVPLIESHSGFKSGSYTATRWTVRWSLTVAFLNHCSDSMPQAEFHIVG